MRTWAAAVLDKLTKVFLELYVIVDSISLFRSAAELRYHLGYVDSVDIYILTYIVFHYVELSCLLPNPSLLEKD